jgi:hypothetical protein
MASSGSHSAKRQPSSSLQSTKRIPRDSIISDNVAGGSQRKGSPLATSHGLNTAQPNIKVGSRHDVPVGGNVTDIRPNNWVCIIFFIHDFLMIFVM